MPSGMDSYDTGEQDEFGCRVWGPCRNQHLPHQRCPPESRLAPQLGKGSRAGGTRAGTELGALAPAAPRVSSGSAHPSPARPPAEAVDVMLQRCEGGVDAALQYAKTISKYMKDLIGYLEKKTTLGECGEGRWVSSGAGLSHRTA